MPPPDPPLFRASVFSFSVFPFLPISSLSCPFISFTPELACSAIKQSATVALHVACVGPAPGRPQADSRGLASQAEAASTPTRHRCVPSCLLCPATTLTSAPSQRGVVARSHDLRTGRVVGEEGCMQGAGCMCARMHAGQAQQYTHCRPLCSAHRPCPCSSTLLCPERPAVYLSAWSGLHRLRHHAVPRSRHRQHSSPLVPPPPASSLLHTAPSRAPGQTQRRCRGPCVWRQLGGVGQQAIHRWRPRLRCTGMATTLPSSVPGHVASPAGDQRSIHHHPLFHGLLVGQLAGEGGVGGGAFARQDACSSGRTHKRRRGWALKSVGDGLAAA